MKRIFFVSAFVIAFMVQVEAQDTLIGPKANYYFTEWLGGMYMPYDTVQGDHAGGILYENARSMYSDTAITVYGIAAAFLYGSECHPGVGVEDTTTQNVYEYLRLYLPSKDGDSLIVINEARAHIDSNLDHFLYTDSIHPYHSRFCRVLETFFEEPSVVSGVFFVGTTTRTQKRNGGNYLVSPMYLDYITLSIFSGYNHHDTLWWYGPSASGSFIWQHHLIGNYIYIFPILDHNCHIRPPEGVNEAVPADLGTVVYPNPAHERVTVQSSIGMAKVEVYNAMGIKVTECAVSNNSTTFDTGSWSRGTYVFRIYTPIGISTKTVLLE